MHAKSGRNKDWPLWISYFFVHHQKSSLWKVPPLCSNFFSHDATLMAKWERFCEHFRLGGTTTYGNYDHCRPTMNFCCYFSFSVSAASDGWTCAKYNYHHGKSCQESSVRYFPRCQNGGHRILPSKTMLYHILAKANAASGSSLAN